MEALIKPKTVFPYSSISYKNEKYFFLVQYIVNEKDINVHYNYNRNTENMQYKKAKKLSPGEEKQLLCMKGYIT